MIKKLLTDLVVLVVGWLINQVPDEEIRDSGERAGKWLTDNARKSLGDAWENIESKLQTKQAVFMGGVASGLDYDD